MPFGVVEWGKILEVIWVSFVAGILVTALFGTVIYASSRAADCRRSGSGGAAPYAALAGTAFVLFAAVVAFGITIILSKS